MTRSASAITSQRRTTVLLFTWAAGSVDAIMYLAGHVFTANMTGNAVLLGIAAGQGKSTDAVHSVIALLAFAAGIVIGAMLVGEGGKPKRWTLVRRAVLLETMILAIFTAVCRVPLENSAVITLMVAASGLAMGLQSATVKRLNLPGIATTYITGTITNLFSGLVHHHWGSGPRDVDPSAVKSTLRLQAAVFLTYTLAAVASGALYRRWPTAVTLLPLIAIGSVTVYMYFRHYRRPAADGNQQSGK
jgi:uncharacterized membrane protein YoaK (UPF0700 family)